MSIRKGSRRLESTQQNNDQVHLYSPSKNNLKDVTEKEWEEVKAEGFRLENERKVLESNKQQLKSGQHEMPFLPRIELLCGLSQPEEVKNTWFVSPMTK